MKNQNIDMKELNSVVTNIERQITKDSAIKKANNTLKDEMVFAKINRILHEKDNELRLKNNKGFSKNEIDYIVSKIKNSNVIFTNPDDVKKFDLETEAEAKSNNKKVLVRTGIVTGAVIAVGVLGFAGGYAGVKYFSGNINEGTANEETADITTEDLVIETVEEVELTEVEKYSETYDLIEKDLISKINDLSDAYLSLGYNPRVDGTENFNEDDKNSMFEFALYNYIYENIDDIDYETLAILFKNYDIEEEVVINRESYIGLLAERFAVIDEDHKIDFYSLASEDGAYLMTEYQNMLLEYKKLTKKSEKKEYREEVLQFILENVIADKNRNKLSSSELEELATLVWVSLDTYTELRDNDDIKAFVAEYVKECNEDNIESRYSEEMIANLNKLKDKIVLSQAFYEANKDEIDSLDKFANLAASIINNITFNGYVEWITLQELQEQIIEAEIAAEKAKASNNTKTFDSGNSTTTSQYQEVLNNGGDTNGDGSISEDELKKYVEETEGEINVEYNYYSQEEIDAQLNTSTPTPAPTTAPTFEPVEDGEEEVVNSTEFVIVPITETSSYVNGDGNTVEVTETYYYDENGNKVVISRIESTTEFIPVNEADNIASRELQTITRELTALETMKWYLQQAINLAEDVANKVYGIK